MTEFLFTDDPENPEDGPDDETAEPEIRDWLLHDYGSMTVAEQIQMAESLDRDDIAAEIRATA
jgi:hypothetical protein